MNHTLSKGVVYLSREGDFAGLRGGKGFLTSHIDDATVFSHETPEVVAVLTALLGYTPVAVPAYSRLIVRLGDPL
jgi:hypothetical protein